MPLEDKGFLSLDESTRVLMNSLAGEGNDLPSSPFDPTKMARRSFGGSPRPSFEPKCVRVSSMAYHVNKIEEDVNDTAPARSAQTHHCASPSNRHTSLASDSFDLAMGDTRRRPPSLLARATQMDRAPHSTEQEAIVPSVHKKRATMAFAVPTASSPASSPATSAPPPQSARMPGDTVGISQAVPFPTGTHPASCRGTMTNLLPCVTFSEAEKLTRAALKRENSRRATTSEIPRGSGGSAMNASGSQAGLFPPSQAARPSSANGLGTASRVSRLWRSERLDLVKSGRRPSASVSTGQMVSFKLLEPPKHRPAKLSAPTPPSSSTASSIASLAAPRASAVRGRRCSAGGGPWSTPWSCGHSDVLQTSPPAKFDVSPSTSARSLLASTFAAVPLTSSFPSLEGQVKISESRADSVAFRVPTDGGPPSSLFSSASATNESDFGTSCGRAAASNFSHRFAVAGADERADSEDSQTSFETPSPSSELQLASPIVFSVVNRPVTTPRARLAARPSLATEEPTGTHFGSPLRALKVPLSARPVPVPLPTRIKETPVSQRRDYPRPSLDVAQRTWRSQLDQTNDDDASTRGSAAPLKRLPLHIGISNDSLDSFHLAFFRSASFGDTLSSKTACGYHRQRGRYPRLAQPLLSSAVENPLSLLPTTDRSPLEAVAPLSYLSGISPSSAVQGKSAGGATITHVSRPPGRSASLVQPLADSPPTVSLNLRCPGSGSSAGFCELEYTMSFVNGSM